MEEEDSTAAYCERILKAVLTYGVHNDIEANWLQVFFMHSPC